mmetsp:Transcript_121172/g.387045  ORF Transcript_121172/g.387045 Transcript_121172/m.387045 type:complete len:508 (+) Transcript_121172:1229-2752(+)
MGLLLVVIRLRAKRAEQGLHVEVLPELLYGLLELLGGEPGEDMLRGLGIGMGLLEVQGPEARLLAQADDQSLQMGLCCGLEVLRVPPPRHGGRWLRHRRHDRVLRGDRARCGQSALCDEAQQLHPQIGHTWTCCNGLVCQSLARGEGVERVRSKDNVLDFLDCISSLIMALLHKHPHCPEGDLVGRDLRGTPRHVALEDPTGADEPLDQAALAGLAGGAFVHSHPRRGRLGRGRRGPPGEGLGGAKRLLRLPLNPRGRRGGRTRPGLGHRRRRTQGRRRRERLLRRHLRDPQQPRYRAWKPLTRRPGDEPSCAHALWRGSRRGVDAQATVWRAGWGLAFGPPAAIRPHGRNLPRWTGAGARTSASRPAVPGLRRRPHDVPPDTERPSDEEEVAGISWFDPWLVAAQRSSPRRRGWRDAAPDATGLNLAVAVAQRRRRRRRPHRDIGDVGRGRAQRPRRPGDAHADPRAAGVALPLSRRPTKPPERRQAALNPAAQGGGAREPEARVH